MIKPDFYQTYEIEARNAARATITALAA